MTKQQSKVASRVKASLGSGNFPSHDGLVPLPDKEMGGLIVIPDFQAGSSKIDGCESRLQGRA
jgi:hypothetical protein